ncbi:MAG: hypothetical protein F2670_01010 [Actinobacteria bacterium]|uniref:Unannotated protein n=1 Tax=freshwater metagenome TaxID=449393 RepID=A0A6J6NYR7_9ZZZZ|nr:hypothetical protein [Actinomycetota bacterium]
MRRFLLALPLFLVVGLLFVELPGNASNNGNQPSVSVSAAPQATPTTSTPAVTEAIAPIAPLPKSNIEGKKGGPKQGGFDDDDEEDDEDDEGFEQDDD